MNGGRLHVRRGRLYATSIGTACKPFVVFGEGRIDSLGWVRHARHASLWGLHASANASLAGSESTLFSYYCVQMGIKDLRIGANCMRSRGRLHAS